MINLEDIVSPDFLKSLSIRELEELADQIRKFILNNVSKTGGHLSSNLGIVELTIALHYVFDCPHDKLIFDVGHQTYTHKILTGRAKDFPTLRKINGLSGFLRYSESPYDCFEAGHSSTSIAAMCGFLEAKYQGKDIGEVIGVIGDGSVQNGLSLSSLNFLAGRNNQKGIIILNDNGMSISKNVGGLAKLLNKVRINKGYRFFKRVTPKFIKRVASRLSRTIKDYAYGDNYFQSLGLKYLGPIDGHNIDSLIKYLNYAKQNTVTTVIHVKTTKGKGYKFAEEDKSGVWHGTGPFELSTGKALNQCDDDLISWSEGISNLVLEQMRSHENILALTPAMIAGSKLQNIKDAFPSRLIDVGINEELCVEMASSLSLQGILPISFIYSSFLQRAYDELNHDIARSNTHAIFMIDRSGIIPEDGDTHQGIFDISMLSHLPNFIIASPKDLTEAYGLIDYSINNLNQPIAIRFSKTNTNKTFQKQKINNLQWEIINPISEINVISYGSDLLEIQSLLPHNIGLINARIIKPLDINILSQLQGKKVYVYEEVIANGSLGSLILLETNKYNLKMDLKLISIDDKYISSGSIQVLKDFHGLNINNFIQKVINGE